MISAIKRITSLESPEVELYRTLKKPLLHRERGVFIAEGEKVVRSFLESHLTALSVLLTDELLEAYRGILEKKIEPIEVFLAPGEIIRKIVGFRYHQGIIAAGLVPQSPEIPEVVSIARSPKIFVAVDKLESAENTGVLLRNCAANGVGAIIVGETSADPYLRRAVRNSMGTVFRLPVIYSSDLPQSLRDLRKNYGFSIFAAHPRPGSVPLQSVEFPEDICIVFGNEGSGISEEVLGVCDEAVNIPMVSGVDSLNVACASAVVLYEITRKQHYCSFHS